MMKKLPYALLALGILGWLSVGAYLVSHETDELNAIGAPFFAQQRSIIPETDSTYFLGTTSPSTKAWLSVITDQLCLTGDACYTSITSSGGGGGGVGWATTSDNARLYQTEGKAVIISPNDISATTTTAELEVVGDITALFITATSTTASSTLPKLTNTDLSSSNAYITNLFIGADTIAEYVADTSGAMVTGNTETGVTVTYQDADNTIDFVVSNLEDLAGTLDVGSGGTGATSFTGGQLLYGNGTNAVAQVATTTLTATAPISLSQPISVIGSSASVITCATASASAAGCLSTTDWSTFNNKISSTSLSFTDSGRIDGTYTSSSGVITADIVANSVDSTYLADEITVTEATSTNFFSTSASATNASTTNFYSSFGNFLTLVVQNILRIPYGTAPTISTNGDLGIDSTSNQFKYQSNGNTHVLIATSSPSFIVASTTKDASGVSFSGGTSTHLAKNYPQAMTMQGYYCKTRTTGTLVVRIGDGTNWVTHAYCTSAGVYTNTTSNNTFTAFEDFQIQFGTATATVPGQVTVTPVMYPTAD